MLNSFQYKITMIAYFNISWDLCNEIIQQNSLDFSAYKTRFSFELEKFKGIRGMINNLAFGVLNSSFFLKTQMYAFSFCIKGVRLLSFFAIIFIVSDYWEIMVLFSLHFWNETLECFLLYNILINIDYWRWFSYYLNVYQPRKFSFVQDLIILVVIFF